MTSVLNLETTSVLCQIINIKVILTQTVILKIPVKLSNLDYANDLFNIPIANVPLIVVMIRIRRSLRCLPVTVYGDAQPI